MSALTPELFENLFYFTALMLAFNSFLASILGIVLSAEKLMMAFVQG